MTLASDDHSRKVRAEKYRMWKALAGLVEVASALAVVFLLIGSLALGIWAGQELF